MLVRKACVWPVLALAMAVGLAACGGDGDDADSAADSTGRGQASVRSVEVVATTDAARQPIDGAPSPDGGVIYFLATGDPGPAVFSVPGTGGTATIVVQGLPLVQPTSIAVATDGSRLFVADTAGVLAVPTAGTDRMPTVVEGTAGRAPRGLDVVTQAGADVIYFTGTNPAGGAKGLFHVPAAGGTVTTVAEGPPLASPDAVVVAADGVAYVSDPGSDAATGDVYRLAAGGGGAVTPVVTDVHLGAPAGVTLVHDDATLLVSSIDDATSSDQLLFLDLATGTTSVTSDVIGANKGTAGGVHRALATDVLAWADVQRPGRVYRVEL
ncbi:MAG: hypothetical protein QOE93_1073 [Actinomycetota bacterium]|nr:hypothetical protein [Actinomycetota bacterium]